MLVRVKGLTAVLISADTEYCVVETEKRQTKTYFQEIYRLSIGSINSKVTKQIFLSLQNITCRYKSYKVSLLSTAIARCNTD